MGETTMGAQIELGLLHYGVQFLSPVPEGKMGGLIDDLARGAHGLFTKGRWVVDDLQELLHEWFRRGREYESGGRALDPIPGDVNAAIEDLASHEAEGFVVRLTFGADLVSLCRLLWSWFLWGRSYQKGNSG